MSSHHEEWLKQSEYDLDTAEYMFNGSRYFYVVFMCHLAVEKGLKAVYQFKLNEFPPKIHNLVALLGRINIKPPENIGRFIVKLNEASVATRYPDEMTELQKRYTRDIVSIIITNSKETLEWIKTLF